MNEASEYASLIDAVLNDDSGGGSATTLYDSDHTTVYKTGSPEPYVVRVSSQRPEERSTHIEILDRIGDLEGLTAGILHTETREVRGDVRTVDVMTYLPGKLLDHYPSRLEAWGIVEAVYALHTRLRSISPGFAGRGVPRLEDILPGLIAVSEQSSMKSRAETLMEGKRFSALLATGDPCLIYGDPWPSNFLIDHEMQPPRVRIVDIDPVFFGPAILQPAVLFSACFVASSLLFPTRNSEILDLDALIGFWPEELDRRDSLLMMRVFPILLSLFKVAESKGHPSRSPQSLQANLDLLERCLAAIDEYDGRVERPGTERRSPRGP